MKTVPTLAEYLAVVRRRAWLIAALTLTAIALAVAYSAIQTPMYKSSANILINQNTSSDLFDPTTGDIGRQDDRRVGNEVRLLRSQLVTDAAEAILEFEAEVEVEAESRVDVVVVTATDADPATAKLVAQTFAEAYLEVRRDQFISERLETAAGLQERISAFDAAIAQAIADSGDAADIRRQQALRDEIADSADQLTITAGLGNNGSAQIIDPAKFPEAAFSPNTVQNVAMALALGLFGGAGVAFLLESLDKSIRSREQLESLTGGAATLAAIHALKAKNTLVTLDNPEGQESEIFRTFRAGIEFATLGAPTQAGAHLIQITSAGASAGKTTVAANLAVVMANSGKRVALIDADLRRPRVHTLFDVPQVPGLSSVIIGSMALVEASHEVPVTNGTLVVLPSGPVPPGPSELLGSKHAERTFQELRSQFDVVIVDSAPVLPVADALMLSRLVDSTVVVVNAKKTSQDHVASTLGQLDQAGANVIGTVLNQVKPQRRGLLGYGSGYGYGYGHQTKRSRLGRSNNRVGRHAGTAMLSSKDLPPLTASESNGFADPISFGAGEPASAVAAPRSESQATNENADAKQKKQLSNTPAELGAFSDTIEGGKVRRKRSQEKAVATIVTETDDEPDNLLINHERYAMFMERAADSDGESRVDHQRYLESDAVSGEAVSYEIEIATTPVDEVTRYSFAEFRAAAAGSEVSEWQKDVDNSFAGLPDKRLYRKLHVLAAKGLKTGWRTVQIDFAFDADDVFVSSYTAADSDGEHSLRPKRALRRDVANIFSELARRHRERGDDAWQSAVFVAMPDKSYSLKFE